MSQSFTKSRQSPIRLAITFQHIHLVNLSHQLTVYTKHCSAVIESLP